MSGEINWIELPAADTGKARTFYGGLFGWGTSEFGEGSNYHIIENGPRGAIGQREDDFVNPRVYFATEDADASVKLVAELGGTSAEIVTMPGVGRIVHCTDDQGLPFSLYEPAQG